MFIKILKSKSINLILAGCLLSTTITPSAHALGIWDFFKKLVVPSTNTQVIPPLDTIQDITTAPALGTKEEDSIFNKTNFIRLFIGVFIAYCTLGMPVLETQEEDSIFNKINFIRLFIGVYIVYYADEIYQIIKSFNTDPLSFFEKNDLKAVAQSELEIIKDVAKNLGFSDKEIGQIRGFTISQYDDLKNNVCVLSDKTIIIGPKSITTLNKVFDDPRVKKFIYGHELSHIKYKHHLKTVIYLPLISIPTAIICKNLLCNTLCNTLLSVGIDLSSLLKYVLKYYATRLTISKIISILESFIERAEEKNCDLNSASLGTDAIIGGIINFEAQKTFKIKQYNIIFEKMLEQDMTNKNNINESYKKTIIKCNKTITGIVNFIVKIFEKISIPFSSHPSDDQRIAYLEKLLTQEQKQQLSIEREKLKQLFSDFEIIKSLTDGAFEDVKVKDLLWKKDQTTKKEDLEKLLIESGKIDYKLLSKNINDQLCNLNYELKDAIHGTTEDETIATEETIIPEVSDNTTNQVRLEKDQEQNLAPITMQNNTPTNETPETQHVPNKGNDGAWKELTIEEK